MEAEGEDIGRKKKRRGGGLRCIEEKEDEMEKGVKEKLGGQNSKWCYLKIVPDWAPGFMLGPREPQEAG